MRFRQGPAPNASGYFAADTIIAPITSSHGAVIVARVSGPSTRELIQALAPSGAQRLLSDPRRTHLVRLLDPQTGQPIDEAMAVFFQSPASFTGEDVLELHCHGGSWITSRILEVASGFGIRMALPGEFSFRAVRNGKMQLSQAQAVADLIQAQNAGAASLALDKLSGKQHEQMAAVAEELRVLSMLGEVGIDFADQDVEEVRLDVLQKRAAAVRGRLEDVRSTYSRGRLLQDGFRVVFLGLPNSGKSSFFNALLGEERSIVSEIAGTTRDSVRETLTLRNATASVTLRLEDTAGVRWTDDQIEQMGIERTWAAAQKADLVLWTVDASSSSAQLSDLRTHLADESSWVKRSIGIVTKSDLISQNEIPQAIAEFFSCCGVDDSVLVSAQSGDGLDQAVDRIVRFCLTQVHRDPGEVLLTRVEHAQAIAEAIELLRQSESAVGEDLFASDVRHALGALSPIIGETLTDEILGRIFSSFCIGK